MPLLYKAVQSNMASEDGENKWYPHLVKSSKRATTETLAEEIARRSSLSPGDVHNVIQNLTDCMRLHLLNSESVHLDGFGTFTVKASSAGNGVSTAEEVSHKQINHLTVHFTPRYKRIPTMGVRYPMFYGAEFVRIDQIKNKSKKNQENK
ncbi:MAG: HU family DNA-binding protein [Bacteroides sp.]|nr:HU family DNA-binding protein [Bacteroides sp.]